MKNAMIAMIFLFSLGSILVATKPTDQECITRARGSADAQDPLELVAGMIEVNKYTVQVEDHIFYKSVYSALDGHHLATGIFGTVILN